IFYTEKEKQNASFEFIVWKRQTGIDDGTCSIHERRASTLRIVVDAQKNPSTTILFLTSCLPAQRFKPNSEREAT
ncbi:TPA: hypothetical protein ACIBXN_003749, partial [Salmonella enterica subsp. diarizonae serovar 48:i:z]